MQYRPEIDGLRAVAVVPVILFHAQTPMFAGGYVGVDIFFVISGYLITYIILGELAVGRFSLLDFYERRARRILPALLLVTAVCIPVAWLLMTPADQVDFARSLVATATFTSNIFFWRNSGYFDGAAELKPLLHTWSLAVEEQYYMLFPIFMMFVWRIAPRHLGWIIAVGIVTSFSIAIWGTINYPTAAFYLLPTRGWELLIGAVLAWYMFTKARIVTLTLAQLGSGLGFLIVIMSVLLYDEHTTFPGIPALLPTLGAALIIFFSVKGTVAYRILSWRPMIELGLLSYGAYLWHQPLFAFARHAFIRYGWGQVEIGHYLFLSVISFALAYVSVHLIEKRFRSKKAISSPKFFTLLPAGTLVVLTVGLSVQSYQQELHRVWMARQPHEIRVLSDLLADTQENSNFGSTNGPFQDRPGCRFNQPQLTEEKMARLVDCAAQYGPGIAILGDSHAIDLYGTITSRFDDPFIVGFTSGGCRPHDPQPSCQYDEFLDFTRRKGDVFRKVIYEQAGFYLMKDEAEQAGSRKMFSEISLDETIGDLRPNIQYIDNVYAYLHQISEYVDVVWMGSKIEPHISDGEIMRRGCDFDYTLRPGQRAAFDRLNLQIAEKVANHDRMHYVDTNRLYSFVFPRDFINCSIAYWSDGDHFSMFGEMEFGSRLPENFLY